MEKSPRQMENSPSHYETATEHETPAADGTKRTASSSSSLPTNGHQPMRRLDSEARGVKMGAARPRLHYQMATASFRVIRRLDRFQRLIASDGWEMEGGGRGGETTRWRVTETESCRKME
ncbi:hypothetical protein VZT92_003319 [Zoarces viviparus]|uniref:Uncharacterized protein n=1 Tax=Zoarces viviparus TaxID=48416 RepID=A0AAW1G1W9_ZOAVI